MPETPLFTRLLICALLVISAMTGLMATDLVLPAIPLLPDVLGATIAEGQYVLAAYVLGNAIGLWFFGAISWRFRRHHILIVSLACFAVVSFLATLVSNIWPLILLRVAQGFFASAPAVVSPGLIRRFFSETGATRAIGILSSLESLAPALGPIVGYWLLGFGDWKTSFFILSVLGGLLCISTLMMRGWPPPAPKESQKGSYLVLLRSPVYLRYALSQALVVGGLITFVFAAPVALTNGMHGSMENFIAMQVTGVTCFILASNMSGFFVDRFGPERVIWFGTWMALASVFVMLGVSAAGQLSPILLPILFAPFNAGLGLRGPPGFLRAVIAGEGQDDRASSLMILAVFGFIAIGTAMLAPFVDQGLFAVLVVVALMQAVALFLLWRLPKLVK